MEERVSFPDSVNKILESKLNGLFIYIYICLEGWDTLITEIWDYFYPNYMGRERLLGKMRDQAIQIWELVSFRQIYAHYGLKCTFLASLFESLEYDPP